MPSLHAAGVRDHESRRRRVPAEQRWLGLDRRTFPPAIFVVAVFLVLTVLVPRIDAAVDWDDPVRPGERLALTDDIALTPVAGWDVEAGFRVGEGGAAITSGLVTLAGDGITFQVEPGDFDGTPSELLDQVEKVTSRTTDPTFRVDGGRSTITTTAGDSGVAQPYSSITGDGLVAALVIDGTGLKITAFGPPPQMAQAADDVKGMVASIRSSAGGVA